ncbi:MerR family transcriptional regulator [Leptolyngbya sp. NK1-12]|uniref:MerR family transcriptional regulator n=2 Tax=Leptolyngbya sp. NK1-12 TaxID=2547451 RepID=A0AA96WK20_9CYAN|nr:MerR family transcriptional regulator [Leptolyngbya sp. NK1-12]
MMSALTIQQVAQQTGLSVHTLRYYERNGLLEPVDRASSGHRRYSEEDIARIEFLTRLRLTGMPIRQMQEFARLFRERPQALADRRAILESHEREVQAHIQELQRNLEAIQWKIGYYKQLEAQQQLDRTAGTQHQQRQSCIAAGQAFLLEQTLKQSEVPESEPQIDDVPHRVK